MGEQKSKERVAGLKDLRLGMDGDRLQGGVVGNLVVTLI